MARTCAGVLARLSGGDGSGLSEVLASAATQCGRLPEALDDLVADLTLAGHLVLLPGAVDDAGPVLDVVALVLERTTDANALDAAMTLLARLLQLRDIPVDAAAAARSIKGAFPRAVARAAAAAVALGRRGAGGIRELHRQGVTEGLKRDARVGAATLSYLLDAAAADAGALADETGAKAFAELLDAVPGRAGALAKAADTCAQALLEALPLLQDAAGQVVDALVTHAVAAPQAQAVPCRVEHVAALCRAREKLGKDDALSLHQATLATADGGKLCFGGYVPAFNDFVKGDLRGASSMRARNACEMVARGAGHGDADVNQALIEGRFPHALLDALKMPERLNDEAFAQNAFICAAVPARRWSNGRRRLRRGAGRESGRRRAPSEFLHRRDGARGLHADRGGAGGRARRARRGAARCPKSDPRGGRGLDLRLVRRGRRPLLLQRCYEAIRVGPAGRARRFGRGVG